MTESNNPNCPLRLELDTRALASNLAFLKGRSPGQQVIASVKANAYGLGVIPIAQALQNLGVDMFATGNLEEARAMRRAKIKGEIMLFAFGSPEDTLFAINDGFVPTVTDVESAKILDGLLVEPADVYIKVDCGLGRLGIPHSRAFDDILKIARLPNVVIHGIYTHVPFGDDQAEWGREKLNMFSNLLVALSAQGIKPKITQALASCCLLESLDDNCNAICIGHALYGLSPFGPDYQGDLSALQPVAKSLSTQLIHIGIHPPGADVAIAGSFNIEQKKTLGILPIGTSHGMKSPENGSQAHVIVGDKMAAIVSVNLEHTTIDLKNIPEARVADEVRLFGCHGNFDQSLEEFAASLGMSPLGALMQFSAKNPVREVCQ